MASDRTGLSQLVGNLVSFREHNWGTLPFQYRSEMSETLDLEGIIWDEVNCGLLAEPFVALAPDVPKAWVTRIVQNAPCEGYLDPTAAREALNSGSAIIFPQAELWALDIAQLVAHIRQDFAFNVSATIVAVPPGAKDFDLTGISGVGASEHVFAVSTHASSRFAMTPPTRVGTRDELFDSTGEPGTYYYAPPGWSIQMDLDAHSTVLLVRLSEPTPQQCAEIALAMFLSHVADQIAGSHHRMTAHDKLEWLRISLPDFLDELSAREILALLASA